MTPEELSAKIRGCTACPLHKGRYLGVPGYAATNNPRISLIGESPGTTENEWGKPHIGPAGALLRKALAAVGIKEDECLFTNVIRCISHGPVQPESIAECNKWMELEYEVYAPRVRVLMGNAAISTQWKVGSINSLRGKYKITQVGIYIPTYNPAGILRNENLMDDFLADLALAKELADAST